MALNKPTPQNIVSITYQLLQEINVPGSIRGQMPVITIQFQDADSIVRDRVVAFVEMLPYLRMLKEKADSLGKVLTCNPPLTYDKKIVINYGDPATGEAVAVGLALSPADPCGAVPTVVFINHAPPFIVGDILYLDNATSIPVTGFDLVADLSTGIIYGLDNLTGEVLAATGNTCAFPNPTDNSVINFTENGVPFVLANALTNILGGAVTSVSQFKNQSIGSMAQFVLPARGNGSNLSFTEDYNITGVTGQSHFTAVWIANTWVVSHFYFGFGADPTTIDFTRKDLIEVNNVANGAAELIGFTLFNDPNYDQFKCLDTFAPFTQVFFNRTANFYLNAQAACLAPGVFNVECYDSNNVLLTTIFNAFSNDIFAIPAGAVKVNFILKRLQIKDDVSVGAGLPTMIFSTQASATTARVTTDTAGAFVDFPLQKVNGDFGVLVSDPAILPFDIKVYKLGALLDTFNIIAQFTPLLTPSNTRWDTLVLGAGAAPAFNIGVTNQLGAIPGETTQINAIDVNTVPVGAIAFPILPLGSDVGTHVGGAAVTVDVTTAGTTVVSPTTVRVIGADFVIHDQPFILDGVYSFPAVNCDGFIEVKIF